MEKIWLEKKTNGDDMIGKTHHTFYHPAAWNERKKPQEKLAIFDTAELLAIAITEAAIGGVL